MATYPSTSTLQIEVLASNDSRHICQLFHLATSIAELGHHVFFTSTPSGIKAIIIDPSTPKPSNLDLVPLPGDNATILKEEFNKFLLHVTQDINWVLFDISTFWVLEICENLGIHTVYVTFASTIENIFVWPVICEPDVRTIKRIMPQHFGSTIAYSFREALVVLKHLLLCDSQNLRLYNRIKKAITTCNVIAMPSYHELDEMLPQHPEQIFHKPVISVGHLPQTATNVGDNNYLMNSAIIQEWLDKKRQCSVVYIAFDTEIPLTHYQVLAIAGGLEGSRFLFIWIIRNPLGDQTLDLPDGFVERTIEYGIVCKQWVPHADILSHPSVGEFLTNGNWNLCLEALDFGIPLILAPNSTAEVPNTQVLQEYRFGCEVKRDPFLGIFFSEHIYQVLKLVMVDQGGEEVRQRVMAMKGVFTNHRYQYLMNFLYRLNEIKKQKVLCKFHGCAMCKDQRENIGAYQQDFNFRQSEDANEL